jgi:hypothetical protein
MSLFKKIKYELKMFLFYNDDNIFGFPEPRVDRTIFRFWRYPAYIKYLFLRFLNKTRLYSSPTSTNHHRYLTAISSPYVGVGHQLANWNATLIYSIKYNLKFVHHPLWGIEGYPLGGQTGEKWNNFLGLGEGEIHYNKIINEKSLKRVNLPVIHWHREDKIGEFIVNQIIDTTYSCDNILFHLTSDIVDPCVYDHTSTADILRVKYWSARDREPIVSDFNNDRLNIAVHIRRGDIMKMNTNNKNTNERLLSNSYFIKIIKNIQQILSFKTINVHIFSQGNYSEFNEFDKNLDNVFYHLNEDEFKTFHSMVIADILLLSPSSFSYFAGIISKGIKIAKYPWWHEIPENSEWIRSDIMGNFNTSSIIQRFASNSFIQ